MVIKNKTLKKTEIDISVFLQIFIYSIWGSSFPFYSFLFLIANGIANLGKNLMKIITNLHAY